METIFLWVKNFYASKSMSKLVRLLAVGSLISCVFIQCRTAPRVPPPDRAGEWSDSRLLFEAAVSVLQKRDRNIKLKSHRFGIIETKPVSVGKDRREIITVRFIQVPGGVIPVRVEITVEKRKKSNKDETKWGKIDRDKQPDLRQRELSIARAIESRFQSWKEAVPAKNKNED